MIRNILVPLDGSKLAEAALPGALWFARIFGSSITLLHVIEKNPPSTVHGEHHLSSEAEAMQYLQKIAQEIPPEIQTEKHVHTEEVSNVPRSIALHAGELAQDLIVMCTHGKGGIREMMMGSIAQQVIAFGATPVLLVHPKLDQARLFAEMKTLLIALDDDPEHACGLELAGLIARRSDVALRLLNVVPLLGSLRGKEAAAGKLLPATTKALLEIEQEGARSMLMDRAKVWAEKGVPVTIEVRRGDPPEQIVQAAVNSNAGMIILGTHGKTGIGAFWAGSVAPRVPGLTGLPLLLVPTCRTYEE